MKIFYVIFNIESKIALFRYFDSLFFGILIPVIATIIIGIFMGNEQVSGTNYSFVQTSFPALITISICTTGIMGFPMNIALYKDKKIFKRFQVTPINPIVLVLSQCVGCFILVIISFICIYLIDHYYWGYHMQGSFLLFLVAYILVICCIYSLGILLASIARGIRSANVLNTLLFFPMMLFSGATIPYEVMPDGFKKVIDFLPLSQGIKLLKIISLDAETNITYHILYLIVVTLLCVIFSIKLFKWE